MASNIKTFKEYTEWGTDEDVRDKVSKTPGQKLPFEEITEQMIETISKMTSMLTVEAEYKGNIGAMELFKFYQVAKENDKQELKKLIQAKKTKDAWQLIQKVTGMKLQGAEFGN